MEKPKMKRGNKPKKTIRKQVGVKLDESLWHKFRVSCMEEGVTAGAKLEELMSNYLKNK